MKNLPVGREKKQQKDLAKKEDKVEEGRGRDGHKRRLADRRRKETRRRKKHQPLKMDEGSQRPSAW